MDEISGRLVLGTAQLGSAYGVANISGKPGLGEARAIVHMALEQGIRTFDTAHAYGDSEQVLGESLKGVIEPVHIVTKLPPDITMDFPVRESLARSLDMLQRESVYGLLLHREEQLPLLDGIPGKQLVRLVEAGTLSKLGVSVYSSEAAIRALHHPLVSLVQLPASLFDRRFEVSGAFALARQLGKELHIRSALLQGVLCMEPDALPDYLAPLAPSLATFHGICLEHALSPASLALAWALQRYSESFVLFGAERPEQVQHNLGMLSKAESVLPTLAAPLETIMPPQVDTLLNPSLWDTP